ncbi:MAG TPA: hypothetical protein VFG21_01990, partial [Xanthomonadaceae bacterium]|nr:hypothetical protein [Xanthomonadaceae bacterium]
MKLRRCQAAWALLVLLPLPGAGVGATLYRCVSATGEVAIQQRPCAAGWQQSWRREVAPEPDAAPVAPLHVPARDSAAGASLGAARAP